MNASRMKATLLTAIIILSTLIIAMPVSAYVEPYYSATIEVDDSGFYFALTVEDDGDWVTWTFDFPVGEFIGDGNLNVGLIIALDGEGEGPAFQIHNNDGTDNNYDWGTWLMSPWDLTIDNNWYGWVSGFVNTPVSELDWVEASGNRNVPHEDGVMTISISKAVLGNVFHWAASPTVGSGFWAPVYDVTMQVPTDFGWGTPIVDMGVPNYVVYPRPVENLNTEITYWTIQAAIDAADTGDTILVNPGTHNEDVTIDVEGLTLESTELHEAIIGSVTIQADGITLKGFDIQGGVEVWQYGDVTVAHNKVTTSTSNGIVYGHGTPSSGKPGKVTHNIVRTPGKLGIYLDQDYIYDFKVTHNTLQGCRKSIGFGSLSGGVIKHNDISGSTEMDVEIFDASTAKVNHNNLAGIVFNKDGDNTLDAKHNFWGTGVESEIIALTTTGPGLVNYDHWFGGESIAKEVTGTTEDPSEGTVDAMEESDTEVEYTATGDTSISVSSFEENPEEGFSNEAGKYYDVYVEEPDAVESLTLKFYYTDADLGGRNEETLVMLWHDGTSWNPCSHQTLHTVSDEPGYSGYIELFVSVDTFPSLDDLKGTPFGFEGEWPEVADEFFALSISGDVTVVATEEATQVFASMGDLAEITVELGLEGYHGDIHFTLYKKVDGGLAYIDEIRTVYGIKLKGSRTASWVVDQNPGNYVVWINIDLMKKVQLTGLDEALHIGPIEVVIS